MLGRKGKRKRESWTARKKGEELREKESRERKRKRSVEEKEEDGPDIRQGGWR